MSGVLKDYGETLKIFVFRALQLGDLLCAVPALRALRLAYPEAQISLLGLPWAKSFVKRFSHYLDEFIPFPGFPGLPETEPDIHAIPEFLAMLQQVEADLVLQMHGSGSIVNPFVSLLGAKRTAGYYLPGEYCPDPDLFIEYPSTEPEIWRHLRLMEHLGIPLQGDSLEFPLWDGDEKNFQDIQRKYSFANGQYVCIHPGSRAVQRRWPPAYFARIGDALYRKGYRVILTGTDEERKLTRAVSAAMKHPVINLAGQTDLGTLAMVIGRSNLLVCNDTGVSHLADAIRTPSVVIFSASDPQRWAPLDQTLHRVVYKPGGPDPEMVLQEVETIMGQEENHDY